MSSGLKLRVQGSNATVVYFGDDVEVLFSYETPVAARICGQWYRTEVSFSVTTQRHITAHLRGVKPEERPQAFFDDLTRWLVFPPSFNIKLRNMAKKHVRQYNKEKT